MPVASKVTLAIHSCHLSHSSLFATCTQTIVHPQCKRSTSNPLFISLQSHPIYLHVDKLHPVPFLLSPCTCNTTTGISTLSLSPCPPTHAPSLVLSSFHSHSPQSPPHIPTPPPFPQSKSSKFSRSQFPSLTSSPIINHPFSLPFFSFPLSPTTSTNRLFPSFILASLDHNPFVIHLHCLQTASSRLATRRLSRHSANENIIRQPPSSSE